jgi:hypothetical protein
MRHHTIVRSSLAELDSTQEVCNSREFSRYSSQRLEFLGCGLSFVLCVQDGYIVVWLVRTVMSGCDVVGQAIASLLVEVGS